MDEVKLARMIHMMMEDNENEDGIESVSRDEVPNQLNVTMRPRKGQTESTKFRVIVEPVPKG